MRRQKLEFSLPYNCEERIKIIGKPRQDHDPEKSGRRLYDLLRSFLPGRTYRSLEKNMVANLLATSCDIQDLQSLRKRLEHRRDDKGLAYAVITSNFYHILETAIEKKKQEVNNIFY